MRVRGRLRRNCIIQSMREELLWVTAVAEACCIAVRVFCRESGHPALCGDVTTDPYQQAGAKSIPS